MKIRIYPVIKDQMIQKQTYCGRDSNGSYYMIDVEHICPHEEFSRESLEMVSWNNVEHKETVPGEK